MYKLFMVEERYRMNIMSLLSVYCHADSGIDSIPFLKKNQHLKA